MVLAIARLPGNDVLRGWHRRRGLGAGRFGRSTAARGFSAGILFGVFPRGYCLFFFCGRLRPDGFIRMSLVTGVQGGFRPDGGIGELEGAGDRGTRRQEGGVFGSIRVFRAEYSVFWCLRCVWGCPGARTLRAATGDFLFSSFGRSWPDIESIRIMVYPGYDTLLGRYYCKVNLRWGRG